MDPREQFAPPPRRPLVPTDDLPADPEWQVADEESLWDPFDPLGDWWEEQERPEERLS
jgi:hypothetical protein